MRRFTSLLSTLFIFTVLISACQEEENAAPYQTKDLRYTKVPYDHKGKNQDECTYIEDRCFEFVAQLDERVGFIIRRPKGCPVSLCIFDIALVTSNREYFFDKEFPHSFTLFDTETGEPYSSTKEFNIGESETGYYLDFLGENAEFTKRTTVVIQTSINNEKTDFVVKFEGGQPIGY